MHIVWILCKGSSSNRAFIDSQRRQNDIGEESRHFFDISRICCFLNLLLVGSVFHSRKRKRFLFDVRFAQNSIETVGSRRRQDIVSLYNGFLINIFVHFNDFFFIILVIIIFNGSCLFLFSGHLDDLVETGCFSSQLDSLVDALDTGFTHFGHTFQSSLTDRRDTLETGLSNLVDSTDTGMGQSIDTFSSQLGRVLDSLGGKLGSLCHSFCGKLGSLRDT